MSRPTLMTALVLLVSTAALAAGIVKLAIAKPASAEPKADELPGFMRQWMPGGDSSREGIGVVDISGVIQFGSQDMGPFSGFDRTAEGIAQTLRRMRRNDKVKAIVLRINSPGGSLGASQEVFEEVRKTAREANKPVVASMGDVAASGGYYVAAPATRIVAYPGTVTGSIGVIVNGLNFKGLMDKHGVTMTTFASGKNKDTMAYWRDVRPDEHELLSEMVQEAYQQFLQAVAEHRAIPIEELEPYADGRIMLGSQAKAVKLVDELGGFRDAVRIAAELAELDPDDPHIIQDRGDLFERLNLRLGGTLAGLLGIAPSGYDIGVRRLPTPSARPPIAYLYQAPLLSLEGAEVLP